MPTTSTTTTNTPPTTAKSFGFWVAVAITIVLLVFLAFYLLLKMDGGDGNRAQIDTQNWVELDLDPRIGLYIDVKPADLTWIAVTNRNFENPISITNNNTGGIGVGVTSLCITLQSGQRLEQAELTVTRLK